MTAYLSLLIAIAGLVIWLAATPGRLADAGRIAYAAGLLAFLLTVPHLVRL